MIKSICYIIAMSIILGLASLEGKQNEKLKPGDLWKILNC